MISVIPIESVVCVKPMGPSGCEGVRIGINDAAESNYLGDIGDTFAGISGDGGKNLTVEEMGTRLVSGVSVVESFVEAGTDVGEGFVGIKVCADESNAGIGQDDCLEKGTAIASASSCGEDNVTAKNEGAGDCAEMLIMEKEYGAFLISPDESNVEEACSSLGTMYRPCEGISGLSHENVFCDGNQSGNSYSSVQCDVPKDCSNSHSQVSIVMTHAENQIHGPQIMEGTCPEKTKPFQEYDSSERRVCDSFILAVEGPHDCSRLTIGEDEYDGSAIASKHKDEYDGSAIASKHNLPGVQICTSEITEEFNADEAEISYVNAFSLAGCSGKSGDIIGTEGVQSGGQTLAAEGKCGKSIVVSADSHVDQQIYNSERTENPCKDETECLSMHVSGDIAHCQENSVVHETGTEESSKMLTSEKECVVSAPVSDNNGVVNSLCSSGFTEEQAKSSVANTCDCGEGSIVAEIDGVDSLPKEIKCVLEQLVPVESDSEKTMCSSAITQETYQERTIFLQDSMPYDADYCRESGLSGQIEEAVHSNKLPYEEKKISTLSVGYSPETASYDPVEGSGSPSLRLSMPHQTEVDGIIASTCGSSIVASLPLLSCDDDSSVQDNKFLKSKNAEGAHSLKTVPRRKSTRLTRSRNIARPHRQVGCSKLVSDVLHVPFSKMARGKRSVLCKFRKLSCWGVLESLLQLFKQSDKPQDSVPSLANERGADHGVLKISKCATSNNRRRTKARANVKGRQRKRKGSLPTVSEKCSATGRDTHNGEPLPSEISSSSLKEFRGSETTDLELEPVDKAISCKSGQGKSVLDDTYSVLFVHHAEHGGEDTESTVAQTSAEKVSGICHVGSSETCTEKELRTKHSENLLCTNLTGLLYNGGTHGSQSSFLASCNTTASTCSEVQLAHFYEKAVPTVCEGAHSGDTEKASLSVKESSICVNAPDVASTSSKIGVVEGTILPLHTYSKKRKREPKAQGRLCNSGETSESKRSLNGQLKQKVSNKLLKHKSVKADNQKCLTNIPVSRRRRARGNSQGDASLAENPSISCHVDVKAPKESLSEGLLKDSPASCGVPSKTVLSQECLMGLSQTPEKHKPNRLLRNRKAASKRCRPNASALAGHKKGKNHEQGKEKMKRLRKPDIILRKKGALVETFDKGKATNIVIDETQSKMSSSEVARTDSPQEGEDMFHVKASLTRGHLPGGDVAVDDTINSLAPLNDNLQLNNSSHEFEGSSMPPRLAWVLCDDCHKWRSIPAELADSIGDTDCSWTCKDNADKRFADCSIPQEKSNAEINAELNISEASCDEDFPSTRLHSNNHESAQVTVPQQDTWTLIKHNVFLHRSHKSQIIDEIMVCHCKPPQDGSLGCGDGCLNRMLSIECDQGTCPCGKLCSNQQFQKGKYAKFKWFRCGKKGYGLQLQEDVSLGRFLIEYVGEVLEAPAYEARQREYAARGQRHFYFMTLNGPEVIDACVKGNLGRFINHSCDPNCRTEKWIVNGEVCIGLFALRDIKKGEEITFDYNYVRVVGAAAKKCFCGSPGCRGYIGGDPLNAETVIESDSEEDFPETVMVGEANGNEQVEVEMFDNEVSLITCAPIDASLETMSNKDAFLGPTDATSLESSDTNNVVPRLVTSSEIINNKDVTLVLPKDTSLMIADVKNKSLLLPAEGNAKVPKSRLVVLKSSGTVKKSKHGTCQGRSVKPKKILIVADRHRFEGVEEKLNELLDVDGGISKRKDAAKGYLKLLFMTASSGDIVNGGSHQSTRDLSIILDALLKTKSRTVLVDIVNKNGLQMLHNVMKQNRKNFNKIPIIRKLLKVLEFLAAKEILNLEHINAGPPCTGMESFRESIIALTRHNDAQVHQMARGFRDKYIPHTIRKIRCTDRDDASSHWIRFTHKNWQSQVARHSDAIHCTSSQATELPSDSLKAIQTSVTIQPGTTENNKYREDHASIELSSSMWQKSSHQGQVSIQTDVSHCTSQVVGLLPGSCNQQKLPPGFHGPAQTHLATQCSIMRCEDAFEKNGWNSIFTEQMQPDVAVSLEPKRHKRKSRWEPLDETRARLYYVNPSKVWIVEDTLNDQTGSNVMQAEKLERPGLVHGMESDCNNNFGKQVLQFDSVGSEAAQSLGNQVPDVQPSDESRDCQFPSNSALSEVDFQRQCSNAMTTVCGKISSHVSPSDSSEMPQMQQLLQHNQPSSTSYTSWSAPSLPFPSSPPLSLDPSPASERTENDLVPPGFEGMRQSCLMELPMKGLEPAKPPDADDTCATLSPGGVANCGRDGRGRRPFFHQRWNSRGHQKLVPPWLRQRNGWEFNGNSRNVVRDGFGAYEVHARQMGIGGGDDVHPSEAVNKSRGSVYSHHHPHPRHQEVHHRYHEQQQQQQQQYPCHHEQRPQPLLQPHQQQLQQ